MKQTFHGKLLTGKNGTGFLLWLMLLLAAHVCPAQAQPQQRMVPPALTAPGMPLLPYLDYFLDKSGEMDEKEITSAENIQAFRKLDLKNLPHESGAVWLRFILAPPPDGLPTSVMFLDLGESVPGVPALKRKITPLPKAGKSAMTCLVRLDGMPGPWFQPMLRTPENVADNWETFARPAGVLALAVVMLLCILRCLTEKGQWRFWTAVYVGMALLQGFLGQPSTDHGRIETGDAVAALAPGMALLLLSHVGRHLAGARNRALNIQFFLLSLPGAALALLPLLSDFSWLTRYFDLWPLGTLLYVPSALGAVMMGIPRTGRFLLGCLLPPLFTAAGLLLAGGDIPANLLASAPLWGIALSAMIIATISIQTGEAAPREKSSAAGGGDAVRMAASDVYNLEGPLGDPNLRIIRGQSSEQPAYAEERPPNAQAAASPKFPQGLVEDAMRLPLEDLMQAGTALERCALPPAVRQYVANMLDAGRKMADIISNPLGNLQASSDKTRSIFNLQHLMRNAHDSVAPMAKTSGIGLAWYMPPHLGHMYEGEAENLDLTVRLLLESAVHATGHGAVQFSVKRVPESADAGHLLFTVKDTGSGMPPRNRSSLALTRVWELVGSHNGFLGMECSPQGTTVAFTLHLKCREDEIQENEREFLPHIIIVAESAVDRQLLSHMLKSLPCKSSETRSLHEALLLHKETPASVLVLHGRFADTPASLLQPFTGTAPATSPPFCKFLGITRDDSRWDAMAQEGFTHALTEPLDSESFCMTVREILDEFPQKGPAAGDEAEADAAEPEWAEAQAQKSDARADDATAPALSDPAGGRSEHGNPPLPDIFTPDAMSGAITQIKVPDITALPDLLSFAESLRDSAKDSIDKNVQITPTDAFGGLFGSGPLHPLDMHPPDGKDADPKKTDNVLPDLFTAPQIPPDAAPKMKLPGLEIPPFPELAVQTAAITPAGAARDEAPKIDPALEIQFSLQREEPSAESGISPVPAQKDEKGGLPGASAASGDSAASEELPPVEQAAQDHQGPRSRLKHARRKRFPRKDGAAPLAPDRALSDKPAGPQENGTSLKETPESLPPPARMKEAPQAARRAARTADDAPVEWVGEPVPVPSSPPPPPPAPGGGRGGRQGGRQGKT
ncbi:MAG: response regulator, partial [Desulfovibrio sp.]|nr:response regulator [Desulfovibrio sp.]